MTLLSKSEVAEMLKVSTRTIERLPIRFVRVGSLRRYDLKDVERYVEKHASRKQVA